MSAETPVTCRVIREPEVTAKTGYSRAALRRLVNEADFPAPIKLGRGQSGAVGWFENEIDAWLLSRPRVIPPIPKTRRAV
jgi:prophage regulatory protein